MLIFILAKKKIHEKNVVLGIISTNKVKII